MAIVSPSILSADFGKLGADCRMVLDAGAQMLHYDAVKAKGLQRTEGKEYVVHDGDVIEFLFNV